MDAPITAPTRTFDQMLPVERLRALFQGYRALIVLVVLGSLLSYAYTTKRYGYAADLRIVDPILYYVPAHSWYFDQDCDYVNQIRSAPRFEHASRYLGLVSSRGRVITYHPVAWSMVALPFLAVADGVTVLHNAVSDVPLARDGYSLYYRWIVPLSHVLLGIVGLVAGYKLAARYFTEAIAACGVFLLWIGTNVAYFVSVEPTMSHAASMAFVTLALYMADTIRRTGWTVGRALWLGLFGGMMGATRYYNVMWTVAPALMLAWPIMVALCRRSDGAKRNAGLLALSCVVACLCFVPQVVTNLINEGHVLGRVGGYAPSWAAPQFVAELSCLRIYPIACLAVGGVAVLLWHHRRCPLMWGLAISFGLHVYVYACATMPGYSRRYLACFVFFLMGLCALLEWVWRRRRVRWAFAAVVGVFCVVNVLLMWSVDRGVVHRRVINDLLTERFSLLSIAGSYVGI